MTILTVHGHTPEIDDDAWVAPTAVVAGDVRLAAGVSVWFGTVVRSEVATITVGKDSNLQDNSVLHADPGFDVTLGERVTVGHRVVLHGCTIEDDVLVGMGAVVLNGAVVGAGSVIGAGAVVTEGTVIPPNSVAVGIPAKVRDLPLPPVPRPNVPAYLWLKDQYRQGGPDPSIS